MLNVVAPFTNLKLLKVKKRKKKKSCVDRCVLTLNRILFCWKPQKLLKTIPVYLTVLCLVEIEMMIMITTTWKQICGLHQGILKGDCTIDLLFDWFGISCMPTENFCFYLQNRLIQTGQTGGQWYSDTSSVSIPCLHYKTFYHCNQFRIVVNGCVCHFHHGLRLTS
jgi:hypothetical protein